MNTNKHYQKIQRHYRRCKHSFKLKDDRNKHLYNVQESMNAWLNEMMKTTQNLKLEFSKEIEILNRSQVEMKIELKNSITQLKTSTESVTSKTDQIENTIPGPEDKVEKLDNTKNRLF